MKWIIVCVLVLLSVTAVQAQTDLSNMQLTTPQAQASLGTLRVVSVELNFTTNVLTVNYTYGAGTAGAFVPGITQGTVTFEGGAVTAMMTTFKTNIGPSLKSALATKLGTPLQ